MTDKTPHDWLRKTILQQITQQRTHTSITQTLNWYMLLAAACEDEQMAQQGINYGIEQILSWIQEDITTSEYTLQQLWDNYKDEDERRIISYSDLLTHPNCPAAVLEEVAERTLAAPWANTAAARKHNLIYIIENPNTTTQTLTNIHQKLDQQTLQQIPVKTWYKNPNTPGEILKQTTENINWKNVTKEQHDLLFRPDGTAFTPEEYDLLPRNIQQTKAKTTSDQTLIDHIWREHPDYHIQLAWNQNTPTKTLDQIYKQHRNSHIIKTWLAQNKNTNKNILANLLKLTVDIQNNNLAYHLTKNPALTTNQLNTLYQNFPHDERIVTKILQHKNCTNTLKQTILTNPQTTPVSAHDGINQNKLDDKTIESYLRLKTHIINHKLLQNGHITAELAQTWIAHNLQKNETFENSEQKELLYVAIQHIQNNQTAQTITQLLQQTPTALPEELLAWNLAQRTPQTDDDLLQLLQAATKLTNPELAHMTGEAIIENCGKTILHTNTATRLTLQKLAIENHWRLPAGTNTTTLHKKPKQNTQNIHIKT